MYIYVCVCVCIIVRAVHGQREGGSRKRVIYYPYVLNWYSRIPLAQPQEYEYV